MRAKARRSKRQLSLPIEPKSKFDRSNFRKNEIRQVKRNKYLKKFTTLRTASSVNYNFISFTNVRRDVSMRKLMKAQPTVNN